MICPLVLLDLDRRFIIFGLIAPLRHVDTDVQAPITPYYRLLTTKHLAVCINTLTGGDLVSAQYAVHIPSTV